MANVMANRRRIAVLVFIPVLVSSLALSWIFGSFAAAHHRLRFQAGDAFVTPRFVVITRGQLEEDRRPTSIGRSTEMHYTHRLYDRDDCLQIVSPFDYRVCNFASSVLYRLGLRTAAAKFSRQMYERNVTTDTSLLWFGYSSTNSLFGSAPVLMTDKGMRIPLTPRTATDLTDRLPAGHVDCWQLPSVLTSPGKYRLVVSDNDRTVVSFVYD